MRWLAWIPPLAIAAGIWWASSTPDLAIASGALDTALRKLAHVGVFAALAAMLMLALRAQPLRPQLTVAVGAVGAFAYAVVDEIHQTQVPTRNGAPSDVAIDALGIGVVAAVAVYRLSR